MFLVGPTAVGKSKLAIAVAERLHGEIISADSMQIYRGMDIGTAKPSPEDRRRIPHHLIDIVSPSESFSVYDYRKLALLAIREIVSSGHLPIVVGGSGLYVRCLLDGLSAHPGKDAVLRRELESEGKRVGIEALHAKLVSRDPERAREIHPRHVRRVVRALEVIEQSGRKVSDWHRERSTIEEIGFEPLVIGIMRERSELYRRVDERVDRMIRDGWVDEVRKLLRAEPSLTALQALGYREIAGFIRGDLTLERAVWVIKRSTRRLSKRQMTWFRKERGIRWLRRKEGDQVAEIADCIILSLCKSLRYT